MFRKLDYLQVIRHANLLWQGETWIKLRWQNQDSFTPTVSYELAVERCDELQSYSVLYS